MTENGEGPYRESSPFLEKNDLDQVEKRWKKEMSRFSFMWIVIAVLISSVFMSFYSSTEQLLIRQHQHYQRILMQQNMSSENALRYDYILDQQGDSSRCAEMCIGYINGGRKTSIEQSLVTRDGCLGCLIHVARPMPFEVANPPCQHQLR